MKKLFLSKFFGFLFDQIRSRFARRSSDKPKFSSVKRRKKLSPKHEHLLKVAELFRNRWRRAAWTKN